MPKILFIIDQLEIGGAQRLVSALTKCCVKRGYRVIVCALQPFEQLRNQIEAAGATVIGLRRKRPSIVQFHRMLGYVFGNLIDIYRLIKKEGIDIVHAHLSDAEFLGITSGLLAKAPCIVATIHGPHLLPHKSRKDPRNFLRIFLTRAIFNRADWIAAVSEETHRHLVHTFGIDPRHLVLIENGIDLDPYNVSPKSDLLRELDLPVGAGIITMVARLTPLKNHMTLFRAVAALHGQGYSPILLVVGEGELSDKLPAQAAALGLKDQVRFLGPRNDIADILSISDIFALPSSYEGTALALLEA
ncbi:MAG: glycosyltransferase, partial [Deltaproteobacteria bacterium]|nr:glycosyltransferase [Deltaproteobacteria bacterium]